MELNRGFKGRRSETGVENSLVPLMPSVDSCQLAFLSPTWPMPRTETPKTLSELFFSHLILVRRFCQILQIAFDFWAHCPLNENLRTTTPSVAESGLVHRCCWACRDHYCQPSEGIVLRKYKAIMYSKPGADTHGEHFR